MKTATPWAPDYGLKGEPYPSQGKRIGPAWSHVWNNLLGAGQIRSRPELVRELTRSHSVSEVTARNLLVGATTAGLLLVHSRGERRVPFLVRADIYYGEFPDEAPEGYRPPRPPGTERP